MPLKLDGSDRKLMLVAGVLLVLLVAGASILGKGQGSKAELPTTFSTASEGAEAAYLLLEESGFQTERWEKSLSDLPDPSGKTLILASPMAAPTPGERESLRKFLLGGGRMIATGMFAGVYLPRDSSIPDFLGTMTWRRVQALSPSAITRAAPEITIAPEASWQADSSAQPLYGDQSNVRVVKFRFGKGEVIWWASATPLTNAGLREPGNLEFFLASIGDRPTEVLWDEYIHGYRETLAGSVWHSPMMWIFLQLGLLSVMVLATFSRRSGPIFRPVSMARLSPLEFVHTLGGLYERAGAASVAVDICLPAIPLLAHSPAWHGQQRFGRRLAAGAVGDRWNVENERLINTLRACESARYHPDLGPAEGLQLVQDALQVCQRTRAFSRTWQGEEMIEAVPKLVEHIRAEMSKAVVGQEDLKTQCILALLCRGHALLEGVPGVAKTLTVKALSPTAALGISARAGHLRPDAVRYRGHQRSRIWRTARFSFTRARSSPICCWWMR